MNKLLENREVFSFSLAVLDKLFLDGVFNEKEREEIASKLAQKYGFKNTSILVTNSLICTLNNESMCMKNGGENSGN